MEIGEAVAKQKIFIVQIECVRQSVFAEGRSVGAPCNNIIWWFEGDCWGLLRLSGTEPLVRIFAEAENREKAQKIIDVLKNSVKSCVGKV